MLGKYCGQQQNSVCYFLDTVSGSDSLGQSVLQLFGFRSLPESGLSTCLQLIIRISYINSNIRITLYSSGTSVTLILNVCVCVCVCVYAPVCVCVCVRM